MAQVNLTTTKNIKLKTKGLYCDEDIEVVPNLQSKEVTPAEVEKEVSADSGFSGLKKVKVNAVPTNYVGSAINQLEAQTYIPTTSDQEIASGQYLRGTQTVKGDANLVAENIAKDVEIFGVVGTHEGGKQPILQDKEVTPTKETQIVMADTGYDGLNSTTVKPIPEEYIIPAGELEITENNTYDVTDKKTVVVNVPTGGGGSDMLQARVDAVNNARYLFYYYTGTDVDYIANLDLSNVTDCSYMFQNCSKLTKMPPLTLSSPTTTNHSSMFTNCSNIKDGSLEITNVGNVHIFSQFANGLGSSFKSDGSSNVEITINASSQDATPNFQYAFQNSGLKTVKIKNMTRLGENSNIVSSMFNNCNIQLVDFDILEYFQINNQSYSPFSTTTNINRMYAKSLKQIGLYNIHRLKNTKLFLGDNCSLAGTTTNHITTTVKFFVPYTSIETYYSTATNWTTLFVNDGNEETRLFVYGEFSSGDTLPTTSGNYNIAWYEDDDFATPAGSTATANKEYYGKISAVV